MMVPQNPKAYQVCGICTYKGGSTMRMRLFVVVSVLLALAPAALAQPAVKVACDRACLEKYIDQYLDAMLAHKVSPELFAKTCRFTENGVQLPLGGEGLWYDMSGKGTYKFYVPDVETQQVAFIGTVKEGGQPPEPRQHRAPKSPSLQPSPLPSV